MISSASFFSVNKGPVQVKPLVNAAPCPSSIGIPETGMYTKKKLAESSQAWKKGTRRRHRRKKSDVMQDTDLVHDRPLDYCLVDTNYVNRLPNLCLSDEKSSEVHVNLLVNLAPHPSLVKIPETGMGTSKNLAESRRVCKKRTRRRQRKKKSDVMENSGLVHNMPQDYGQVDTNYVNRLPTLSDERSNDGHVNLLINLAPHPSFVKIPETGMGTNKNLAESRQVWKKRTRWRYRRKKSDVMQNSGLAHNMPQDYGQVDTKCVSSLSTLSLSDVRSNEVKVNHLVHAAPCPSFVRIPEKCRDTKNHAESNQVLQKKTRRHRWNKSDEMKNTGLVHNMPQDYGQVDTKYVNRLSTLRLSDEKTTEVVGISSGAVQTLSEEDKSSGISHGSTAGEPFIYKGKKLLILDLNGIIADIVCPPPKGFSSDIRIAGRAIFKRPFYLDFLQFCFEHFEVGVWSSRSKKVIERVVDYLLGDLKEKLLFCWDLSHCTATGFRTLENRYKTVVFKELRRIWENDDPSIPWEKGIYNESNTLLLDDSPYKALLNPVHTGVFPYPYTFHGSCDNELGPGGRLRTYLEKLATVEDIQEFVDQHPFGQGPITEGSASWNFYLKVLNTVYSVETNEHNL